MKATIHDVAEKAGVSTSTVSRVLNGTAHVSEEKRGRVQAAVAELDYIPNLAARRLVGRTTGGVGVVLPYITGGFFSDLIDGIDEVAHAHNLFVLVSASHRSEMEFSRLLREMVSRVDGIIVMATDTQPETLAESLPRGMPMVLVNTPPLEGQIELDFGGLPPDEVRFDNYGGAVAVTQHLIEQGHRRLVYVRGPENAYDAEERLRGFRDALRAHGLDPEAALVLNSDFSQEAGYRAGQTIARLDPLPDAVFANNDLCASGVLAALHDANLSVPDDLALAGFDDIPMARYTLPPLTTAHVPVREVGARAVELLIRHIDSDADVPSERHLLPVDLVPRASSMPGASR